MPDLVLNVLAFFAVLLVLVLAHELGHFVTAKLAGVDVQEFGFGYPPKLFGVHFKGTEYTFNLLPLGGFVKMLGEEDPKQTGSFAGKSIPARLIILAAGSGMNALLPILLISGSLMLPREVATGPVVIQQVMNASPAERAGLLPGDTIVRINDRSVASIRDVGFNIHLNLGSPLEMEVERGGSPHVLHMTPRWHPPAGQGATGIVIGMPDGQIKTVSRSLPDAFGGGVRQSLDMITLFKNGIISTFGSGGGGGGAAIAGPIGIAQVTGGGRQSRRAVPPGMGRLPQHEPRRGQYPAHPGIRRRPHRLCAAGVGAAWTPHLPRARGAGAPCGYGRPLGHYCGG